MSTATITTDGLNLKSRVERGLDVSLVAYVALGSGTSTPTNSQHALDSEVFRKAITSVAEGSAPGEILINMYLSASDANGLNIQEVGFFGGSSAGGTPNSGIMFARALYSPPSTKSVNFSVQFQLDITPSAV